MQTSKRILITGATSGIGRHAALFLAKKGHQVFAAGRNEKALAELGAAAAEAGNSRLHPLRLDVTSKDSIAAAVIEVGRLTDGQGLDVLVNNAGYGLAVPTEELSDEDLRAQFDTNVFGLMSVTRAFLPAMRRRGAGRIINVSSVGGRLTLPLLGGYNATKYAVESLSDALRYELAAFGIGVVLVEPGVIKSDFAQRSVEGFNRYRRADSPYAPMYARANQIEAVTNKIAAGPEHVTRAIEHAVLARRPPARYVVPFATRLSVFFVGFLPTRVVDWMLRLAFGLTARRLAVPAAATTNPKLIAPTSGAAGAPGATGA